MYGPAVRIAIDKCSSPDRVAAIEAILDLALRLDEVEAGFESRINASKAARGERPTRLTRARAEDIAGYARDAEAMQAQQLAEFQTCAPDAILRALRAGLASDLKFWRSAGKYAHPADLPVVQEFVGAKEALYRALCDAT